MKIFLEALKNEDHHEQLSKMYIQMGKEMKEHEREFLYAKRRYEFNLAYYRLLEIMKDVKLIVNNTIFKNVLEDKYLFQTYDINYIMGHSKTANALETINRRIDEYKQIRNEKPEWANEARKYARIIDNFLSDREKDQNLY